MLIKESVTNELDQFSLPYLILLYFFDEVASKNESWFRFFFFFGLTFLTDKSEAITSSVVISKRRKMFHFFRGFQVKKNFVTLLFFVDCGNRFFVDREKMKERTVNGRRMTLTLGA